MQNAVAIKEQDDGLLDVGDLCRMFEEAEDSTVTSRKESERDRDYVDNKQLTAEELAVLAKRGQPPQIDNRIKTKIDFLVGLEKQQRIDPKALPRTPMHETDADAATQALRYVAEEQLFDNKRSGVWRNMLVEGSGGIRVYVEKSKYGPKVDYQNSSSLTQQEHDICLQRIAWDRLFHDPHSSELDFSDAGYLGIVTWLDYDDALAMYPDGKDILDATLSGAPSDTYDDKPKFSHWADKKRKRVRICQIWVKRAEEWYFAEYTKGGILKAGPSPYRNDKGESDCELFFQSAYIDRDNNRYGLVREMITLQDGINKRNSKALHLLNTVQITVVAGAVDDVEKTRREAARPDGVIEINPLVGGTLNDNIKIETRQDLAAAQLGMLQEAKNAIDLKGPNATQMGDKTQGSSAASGKAILASQQGGMISLGDLLDNLRHLDRRVFRAIWARVRQYWTAEKWIRITDDERNIKWVGMNLDPQRMQQVQMLAQSDPEGAKRLGGVMGSIAELDCDIIIDEVPDNIASQEQFGMLVDLKKMDAKGELPFRALVVASSIKDKSKMLDEMDKEAQARQGQPDPEMAKTAAQLQAKQQEAQQRLAFDQQKHAQDMEFKEREASFDRAIKVQELEDSMSIEQFKAQTQVDTERMKLGAHVESEREKSNIHRETEREKASVQREAHEHKLNSEKSIKTESRRDPNAEKLALAVAEMGSKIGEGMTEMAGAIAGMGEKIASPKKLVRDKQGNIIGSEPTEGLRA